MPPTPDNEVTRRTLPVVAFTFVVYFSVGAPLALLPTYAHLQLGLNASIAGLLVSLQYVATFASRPSAGRMADTHGPQFTVRWVGNPVEDERDSGLKPNTIPL